MIKINDMFSKKELTTQYEKLGYIEYDARSTLHLITKAGRDNIKD